MNLRNSISAILVLAAASISLYAEEMEIGFFSDGYLYKHTLNPALGNDRNYVAIPIFGNLQVGVSGNVGITDFLYIKDGRTVTFLNDKVGTQEFTDQIKDKNRLMVDAAVTLLSSGFKGFGGYNTISLSAQIQSGITMPGELLRVMKEGIGNQTYTVEGTGLHATSFLELALGHSRQWNEKLRVGAKVKFLLGIANMDAKVSQGYLTLGENGYEGLMDAEVHGNVKGLYYKTTDEWRGPDKDHLHTYVNDLDVDGEGPGGFGLALDLGADYRLNEDWRFDASLSDIGFIRWNTDQVASTGGPRVVNTDSFLFNVDDDADNSFDRELDRLAESLCTLYELQDMGDQGARTTALHATMRLAAEYTFPLYRRLTFGLMNTTRFAGDYGWTDFRLSANVAPTGWFSATAAFSEGSFGPSFGWLLNFHPKAFNFFIGMDHASFKVAKQGVPLGNQYDVNLGINVSF